VLRSGLAAAFLWVILSAFSSAAAAPVRLGPVSVKPPVGLLGVEEKPSVTFRPQSGLPRGSYYYAVAVLVHYRPKGADAGTAPCAISSDMGLTEYGRPGGAKSLQLTLLPASASQGRWCAGGTYEGAVYAVPHPPPCNSKYPCYGRGSGCGEPRGVCGVVINPGYSYPGGLPKPIDRRSRVVGHFKLLFGDVPGPASGIEPEVATKLLAIARRQALTRGGDAHPYDIEAVRTDLEGVANLEGGTAGPSSAGEPVYLVALRGGFACIACSVPLGAKAPRGPVMTLTITASGLLANGFGLPPSYPDLRRVGDPVRLG